MTALLAGAIALPASHVDAEDRSMIIAVFTKNTTNPAYSAFRLAADQVGQATGARILHFVPRKPDNVEEQKAMVEQVLRPSTSTSRRVRWWRQ
jgi:ribose transport system substrate-binding protein